jgi:hypothetical protein
MPRVKSRSSRQVDFRQQPALTLRHMPLFILCIMHGMLVYMAGRQEAPPPLGLVAITSPDGHEHLVDEQVFARTRSGRWPARCGVTVVSAALDAGPGRPCVRCTPSMVAR